MSASNATAAQPLLTEEERLGLKSFWTVYDANRTQLQDELLVKAKSIPAFASIIESISADELAERSQQERALQHTAVFEGEWKSYRQYLVTQGAVYAQLGIEYGAWSELLHAFRKTLLQLLISAYHDDLERFHAALLGMERYVDIAISAIGEGYLKAKEQLLSDSQTRHLDIFNHSNVSLWELDFDAVFQYIDQLQTNGVQDFHRFFNSHPEIVQELVEKIEVLDVSLATLRLLHAESKEELLSSLSKVFLEETLPVFRDEFIAFAEGKTYFSGEARIGDMQGGKVDVLFSTSLLNNAQRPNHALISVMDNTDRKRAEREQQRLTHESQVIHEIARILASTLNIDEVYERFASEVRKLVDFNRISVNWIDHESNCFIPKFQYGAKYASRPLERRLPLQGSMTQEVILAKQTLARPDILSSPTFVGDEDRIKSGVRSIVLSPIISNDIVIATLGLHHQQPGIYQQKELAIIEQLSTQIAPAIENALLFQELEMRVRETAVADEIAQIITSTLNIDQVYEKFALAMKNAVEFDRININIIDHESNTFEIRYAFGEDVSDRRPGALVPLSGTPTELILQTSRLVYEADIASVSRLPVRDLYLQAGLRSAIFLPLTSNGLIIGSLGLFSSKVGAFGHREHIILERLANQIAPAIENAALHEESQNLNIMLEQRVVERTNQLEEANKELQWQIAVREEAETELAAKELLYRTLVEAIPHPICLMDAAGNVTFLNQAWHKLVGIAERQSLEQIWMELVHPDDTTKIREAWQEARQEEREGQVEFRILSNGEYRTLLAFGTPVRNEWGKITSWVEIDLDVTESRQTEAEIRRLNQELARQIEQLETANHELESFSYSISHDLRAPLRAVNGFSQILLEEYAPQLDAEAQRYLRLVSNNAQQMGDLIDDLLKFSRLSRYPLEKQWVDPEEVARDALYDIRAEIANPRVEISIGKLPQCQADPSLLRQVFVNLLSNALKYSSNRELPTVEVGVQQQDSLAKPIYYVRDNGVGFDMAYAHKMFGVFQRLHRTDEYPGTGVGLAIVQRIVHRHGGQVWAEGKIDQGATFYFSLEE